MKNKSSKFIGNFSDKLQKFNMNENVHPEMFSSIQAIENSGQHLLLPKIVLTLPKKKALVTSASNLLCRCALLQINCICSYEMSPMSKIPHNSKFKTPLQLLHGW